MVKKKIDEMIPETNDAVNTPVAVPLRKVEHIRQEFGNGDMNTLRDKINEIIG